MALADAALSVYAIAGSANFVLSGTVSETASASDTVSTSGAFGATVAETANAVDQVAADGQVQGSIAESASATDSVSSTAVFPKSVSESAAAADTVSVLGAFTAALSESAPATDTFTVTDQMRLYWYLSFASVVPPPVGQGPGNPGVMKGGYRLEPLRPPRYLP